LMYSVHRSCGCRQ